MSERISPSRLIFVRICFVAGLVFSLDSYAVERPILANARIAQISSAPNRTIVLNKKVRQLTAGAQIRNQQNVLIQPHTLLSLLNGPLADAKVQVMYTENNQGQIHRLWILTSAETEHYSSDKSQ